MATVAPPDTRERILRATVELIGREGISAVTNRRVAGAAGVALGSLTYHFPSQVDLLRESLLLFVGEEVARQEAIAADLRRARPERRAGRGRGRADRRRSPSDRIQQLAEIELHLQAARDPALREASRRCFEAYEGVAAAALETLEVPEPERHARTIVALMYGMGLRRLGTGDEDASGVADGLLTIVRGAAALILAIDQGTTGHDLPRLRRGGTDRRPRLLGVRAALPAARLGRARRRRDLGGDAAGRRARRSPTPASRGRELDGDRDHQPARDRGRLGPGDRRADPPGAGLAGPAHRRALRRAARGRARAAGARADRPRPRPLLLRRPRSSGCCATSRGRSGRSSARSTPGCSSSSPAATPPTTPTPRGRCSSTSAASPGTRSSARCSASTRRGCPSRCPRPTSTAPPPSSAARCRWPGSPATSRRPSSARPAIEPGTAKNTYGTGSFVLLNTGAEAPEPGRRPAGDRRLRRRATRPAYALEASIFVTGAAVQWLRDGLGIIERGGGDRGARRLAGRQRRRLLRPGADRARLAALGSLRARHDRRPDPRQRPRPPGAGGAGGDRLPDRRRGAGPGGGRGRAPRGAEGRRRRRRQPLADAVPGRRARRAGGRARDRRDDRARRRLPGRDRDRPLEPGAGRGDVARGGALRAARWAPTSARRCSATGAGRSSARGAGRARERDPRNRRVEPGVPQGRRPSRPSSRWPR